MTPRRAVTLDLWRTLIAENPSIERGTGGERNARRVKLLTEALLEAGHPVDQDALQDAFARIRDDMDMAHRNGVDRVFRVWVRDLIEYALPGAFDRFPEDVAQRMLQAVDEPFLRNPPAPHPAATGVLRHLAQRGVCVALISNTGFTSAEVYRRWFRALGWGDYFHLTTFSNEAAVAKPTAEIFLATVEEMGVEPRNTLHVGDSLHNDVTGASKAGLHSVWLRGGDPSDGRREPDYVIDDLSELPNVVDRWLYEAKE